MAAFYNRATLNYGGSAIDSNTVRGELNAALAVAKSAVNASYRPGDTVAFAVTITNSGSSDADGLQIRDDLGAYAFGADSRAPLTYAEGSLRYLVGGELQLAPQADVAGDSLVVRGIRVPAGGDAAILYAARVNEFAPLGEGASITNTVRLDDAGSIGTPDPASATITPSAAPAAGNPIAPGSAIAATTPSAAPAAGNPGAPAPAMARAAAMPDAGGAPVLPAFASAVIAPEAEARLTIRKALTPESVSPGEELTYTLTIENEGALAVSASENATVSDVFNPRLNISSVRFNGQSWSAPANYSYDANSGAFATAPGQLAVPAASFIQDAATGRWQTLPGTATIEITGTLR